MSTSSSLPSYTSATIVADGEVPLLTTSSQKLQDEPIKESQTTTNNENTKEEQKEEQQRRQGGVVTRCSKLHGRAKEQQQLWEIHQSNLLHHHRHHNDAQQQQEQRQQRSSKKVILIRGPQGCGKTELVKRTLGSSSSSTCNKNCKTACSKKSSAMNHHGNKQHNMGHLMIWKADPQTLLQIGPGISAAFDALISDVVSRTGPQRHAIQQHLWRHAKLDTSQIATLLQNFPVLEPFLVNPALSQSVLQQQQNWSEEMKTHSRPEYSIDYSSYKAFLGAISTFAFPMTFISDDLHWIEPNSLEWVVDRVSDADVEAALFVATYTDGDDDGDADSSDELWRKQIKAWKQDDRVEVTEISLQNLDESGTHDMVAEMLGAENDSNAKDISSWIFEQTKGNPQYVEDLLLGLHDEGLLSYADTGGGTFGWTVDVDLANVYMSASEDENSDTTRVSTYLARAKLSRLSEALQDVLKVAACFGCCFQTNLVKAALTSSVDTGSTAVEEHLDMAKDAGIIVDSVGSFSNKFACRFVHNSMHEAAISLVGHKGSAERGTFHLELARKLLRRLSDTQLEADLLNVTSQLIYGAGAIKTKAEKYQCAQLAFRATQACVRLTSFKSAQRSISFAIRMLTAETADLAWREEYDLTLASFNAAAEVAYANGNYEIAEKRVDAVLKFARCFEDRLQASSTKLYMLGSMSRIDEALELGYGLLEELGEPLPNSATMANIVYAMYKTKSMLKGKSNEVLLRSPVMVDGRIISAMQIMNIIFTSVFVGKPTVVPLLATRMVRLSLKYGFCAISCFGFSMYGVLLCARGAHVEEGTRFGDLSLRLLDRFQAKEFIPRVYTAVHGSIYGWSRPFAQCYEPLLRGHRVGLETGDIEFAMLAAALYLLHSFDKGKPLSALAQDRAVYIEQATSLQQESTVLQSSPLFYTIDRLMGVESVYSFDFKIEGIYWVHYQIVTIAFIEGDYEKAVLAGRKCNNSAYDSFDIALVYMFEGLANLAWFKETGKRGLVSVARRRLKTLDRISKLAVDNCLCKFLVLQAELSSLSPSNHADTVRHFLCAIALADSTKSLLEGAVAHELYGRYMGSCGKKASAACSLLHLQTACSLYRQWNAYPKADALQNEIDQQVI